MQIKIRYLCVYTHCAVKWVNIKTTSSSVLIIINANIESIQIYGFATTFPVAVSHFDCCERSKCVCVSASEHTLIQHHITPGDKWLVRFLFMLHISMVQRTTESAAAAYVCECWCCCYSFPFYLLLVSLHFVLWLNVYFHLHSASTLTSNLLSIIWFCVSRCTSVCLSSALFVYIECVCMCVCVCCQRDITKTMCKENIGWNQLPNATRERCNVLDARCMCVCVCMV